MLTRIMKWLSVTALLLGLLLRSSAGYQVVLQFVVCVSALVVVAQAGRAGKYLWAVAFTAIAVFFNPILSVALSHKQFLWLDWISVVTFLLSLAVLKPNPVFSAPSITNPTPGSESL